MNRVASRAGGNDGQKRAASCQDKTKGRRRAGGPSAEVQQQCSCAVEAAGAQGLGSVACRQHAAAQGRLPLSKLETLGS